MKKTKATVPVFTDKLYKPAPHPQQHRIDDMRVIPSLVTAPKHLWEK